MAVYPYISPHWRSQDTISSERLNAISDALQSVTTEINDPKIKNIKDGNGGYSIIQNSITGDYANIASNEYAHAEGFHTVASGACSHAEGCGTIANHAKQHVFGKNNIVDPSLQSANEEGSYIEIVGNGTDEEHRSNARTLDWEGNQSITGNLILKANTNDETIITPQKIKIIDLFTRRIQVNGTDDLNVNLCIDRLINMLEHWTGGNFGDNSNDYGEGHILDVPIITRHPLNREIQANAYTVFDVESEDADSFQWQYSTNNGQTWYNCATPTYHGAKTLRVIFLVESEMDGYLYRVAVSNSLGTVYSNPASLTIIE